MSMKKMLFGIFLFLITPFVSLSQPVDLNELPEEIVRVVGPLFEGESGAVVKAVGDFNGDGFKPDIAISSPGSGVVHILLARSSNTRRYPLKPGLDGIFQFLVVSDGIQGSKFGTSIAALGDFNRDGKDDIAVGAPGAGEGGTVYVVKGFFNSFSGSQNPFILTLEGGLGESIGNHLPDGALFNEDTFADLLVPTAAKSPNRSAYLIYGSAEYNDAHLTTLTLNQTENAIFAGLDNVISPISANIKSIGFIGDYTGNGSPDIAVYSGIDETDQASTLVHIIPGGSKITGRFTRSSMPAGTRTINISAFSSLSQNIPELFLGGDVNGDGYDDLLMGFPRAKIGDSVGALCMIPGLPIPPQETAITDLEVNNISTWHHPFTLPNIGATVSLSGHKIALGRPDMASPFVADATPGAALVIGGSRLYATQVLSNVEAIAESIIYGRRDGDQLGVSVALIGDSMNSDGIQELAIGVHETDDVEPALTYILTPPNIPYTPIPDWSIYE